MGSPVLRIINNDVHELSGTFSDANAVVRSHAANELIFAVVGHVGSGTSLIAGALAEALSDEQLPGGPYETHVVKARPVLVDWAKHNHFDLGDPDVKSMQSTERLQDCGDAMRERLTTTGRPDYAAVAKGLIRNIRDLRQSPPQSVLQVSGGTPSPTSQRRAYILDALRHPAEVHLLRRIYDDAFVLIGVACEEEVRRKRLFEKFPDAGTKKTTEFMRRDAKAAQKHGQRVADTFHLADYFLDNTISRAGNNRNWNVLERLGRLVRIVSHTGVTRPEVEETAMHHANAAMMQSACLSRQVGAALLDSEGALIATGTNEVPRGGGGVYGESVKNPAHKAQPESPESRCALRGNGPEDRYCSNTREQAELISDLIKTATDEIMAAAKKISAAEVKSGIDKLIGSEQFKKGLAERFRDTRVGGLLEFSRAVHAEMDALLTAGRTGSSTIGARLFVTTFPCHYCARHIVSAGIDEVQYIEPYPKSLASKLHNDSIEVVAEGWTPPSQGGSTVLFRPFSGVAPRFYRRAFLKDRELKDGNGNYFESAPEWGDPYYLSTIDYRQMEAELIKDGATDGGG